MTEGYPPPPPNPGDPDPTRRWPGGDPADPPPPVPPYTPPTGPTPGSYDYDPPTNPIDLSSLESGPDRVAGRWARLGNTIIELAANVTKRPLAAAAGKLAVKAANFEGKAEELADRDPNVPNWAMKNQRRRAVNDVERASQKADRKRNRAATEAPAQYKERTGAIGGLRSANARRKGRKVALKITDPEEARAAHQAAAGLAAVRAPGRGQRYGSATASRAALNPNAPGIINPHYSGVDRTVFGQPTPPGDVPLRTSMPGVHNARRKAETAAERHDDLVEMQQSRLEGSKRARRIGNRNNRRATRRGAVGELLGGAAEFVGEVAETVTEAADDSRERIKEIDDNAAERRAFKNSKAGKAARKAKSDAKKAAKRAKKETPPSTPTPEVNPGDDDWYDPGDPPKYT